MRYLALLPFFLLALAAQAQRVHGRIIDQQAQPLEYVNIGVVGKNVGTVSTAQGTFALTLPPDLDGEILQFSAIGYAPVQFKVAEFKQRFSGQTALVQLKEQAVALKEVVVRPKKFVTKVVGNTVDSKTVSAGFTSNDLGSEVGTLLKIRKPSFLESVRFNLAGNKYDTLFLRVNVYKVVKNVPTENVLREPIYLNVAKGDIKDGLTLDLSRYNVYLESDALLSLELVRDLGTGGLWFSGGFINSDSYYRKASQGSWQKVPLLGLGFSAVISQEK
ncbi:carboxypeptidase-like regulatory domain-containing protein [Rufibacter ruber]|uniref:carboxypeptidase-like regulatory domain-containing protein n=1 Tax=Rufibacter ruber TaxID=1783499 RepID=UPI000830B7DE|nr:carboxypeptidase-like regulatory domain-containing protein [Rufibacter ruber]